MWKVPAFTFVALLLIGTAWAQTEPKPYSRAAAEKSFRTLVTAKDPDIMDLLKNDGYVCFAEALPFNSEDRFLTIDLMIPTFWVQDKSSNDNPSEGSFYDGKTDFPAISKLPLYFHEWVNQDWTVVVDSRMLDGMWYSFGHYERTKTGKNVWKPYSDIPPVFRLTRDADRLTGEANISAMEDGTTFYATKKYGNKNNGTTAYEMNMRLSTGRYKETWTPDKGDPFESVGNCYKAKEFLRSSTPAKKTK